MRVSAPAPPPALSIWVGAPLLLLPALDGASQEEEGGGAAIL